MKTITLKEDEQQLVRSLATERPGVSAHRVARAIWRLGLRVLGQQEELVDDELAAIMAEAAARREAAKGAGR